jgi:uncharacterized membrane protein (UPF0127 family)
MFRAELPPDEGLLFVYGRESKLDTTIHMLFMRFSIAVIWMDADGIVVDQVLAKPWRLAYAPQQPAQYFVEASPALLDRVKIGDRLRFDEAAATTATEAVARRRRSPQHHATLGDSRARHHPGAGDGINGPGPGGG